MRLAFIASALALAIPTLSLPNIPLSPVNQCKGPVNPGSYIIKLKEGVLKDAFIPKLLKKLGLPDSCITHDYFSLIPAIVANLKPEHLPLVHLIPGVESINPDIILSLKEPQGDDILPSTASSRVAGSRDALVRRTDGSSDGQGVTIYGIDSGINTDHRCFAGRASFGANFVNNNDTDQFGHGTHTAGIATCEEYGGAKGAKIIALKVLDEKGSGPISAFIAAVQWALEDCKAGDKSCIVNMSIGGFDPTCESTDLDDAVRYAISRGLHFTVAAGNTATDVNLSSITPARVKEVNTIGAVDSQNQRYALSNYGSLVDVWAPGVNVKSTWIGGPDAEHTMSGTSMAAPYVASILAKIISKYGNKSPAALSEDLKNHASPAVIGALFSTNKLATAW
ncbi:peptidase S8/S53 domain-containing protein [Rhizoctonia solani]|nr:peptidase S8/S53 domain-containing protein [Rhizoctonia solani]